MNSDMDLINEMFDTDYDDTIGINKDEAYYIGKAENILKQLDNKKNYFVFIKIFLKNYHTLDKKQKGDIIQMLDIKPIEKIVNKDKPIQKQKIKNSKPKINMKDDY